MPIHIWRRMREAPTCCYTSKNATEIGSEEYIDALIEWGALFCWIFTYMPVGVNAVPELIATADQREYMYRQIRKFRENKPLFTMDFWNDGEYVNGCIAGGRYYLHINANGDIEPCAFVHFSDSNIKDKTLLEAYKSPLFMPRTVDNATRMPHTTTALVSFFLDLPLLRIIRNNARITTTVIIWPPVDSKNP